MSEKILVFASGGGSGFENLVTFFAERPHLGIEIVGVVSNHEHSGVRERADRLGVPFWYMPGPYTAEEYQRIAKESDADWFALSGWLKLVVGLPPTHTFNIHPGPLPRFGGKGMYGHHVHEAVLEAYHQHGDPTHSAVTMHFVTGEYDQGPILFQLPVEIKPDDDADSLAKRVNREEHYWQPRITHLVVSGLISWDGQDPSSLNVPKEYTMAPSQ